MCEVCAPPPQGDGAVRPPVVSRRGAVAAALGFGAAAALASPQLASGRPRARSSAPAISTRSAWGADLPPQGPLEVEQPGDVRFLLVHHTAGANDDPPEAVPDTIRSIYRFHTGADKGWPDVAYNFFVDRHGGIWEGRQGSIDAPVMGSATGGSQGFAQLCCFLGTFTDVAPTPAAQTSMVTLLAWLADRYDIDTGPGATTQFVSRGSNLHPAGTTVNTPTIAGHRDMSSTACPGDAAYALVTGVFPGLVSDRRSAPVAATTTVPVTTAPTTTAAPSTEPAPTTSAPTLTSTPTTEVIDDPREAAAPAASGDAAPVVPIVAALGVTAAAAAGAVLLRRRAAGAPDDDSRDPGVDDE